MRGKSIVLVFLMLHAAAVQYLIAQSSDPGQAAGVTASGRVSSLEPISGATITVMNTDVSAVSGLDGAFSIVLPIEGTYVFLIRAPGYRNAVREINVPTAEVLVFELEAISMQFRSLPTAKSRPRAVI